MLIVRFEDESLVVVEKPAGMHTAPLHPAETGTLLELVIEAFPEVRDVPGIKPVEPGLLHRLDRDTSGLVVVARTARALEALRGGFESTRKEYLAVCAPDDQARDGEAFTVTSRFAPYGPGRRRVRVVMDGDAAIRETTRAVYETGVTVVTRTAGCALIRAALSRGFRHQVRAHLSHAGYPILGDILYGRPVPGGFAQRMYLHASRIELPHPVTGAMLVVESPTPQEFAAFFLNTGSKGATT